MASLAREAQSLLTRALLRVKILLAFAPVSIGALTTEAFRAIADDATMELDLGDVHRAIALPLLGLAALSLSSSRGRLELKTRAQLDAFYRRPTWSKARALLRRAAQAHRIPLLRRAADAAGLIDASGDRTDHALALVGPRAWEGVDVDRLGTMYEALCLIRAQRAGGRVTVGPSLARRRAGSHYTPRTIADAVARRTLMPLLREASPKSILDLRICDPAMGAGAFLLAACRCLAEALHSPGGEAQVAATCIRGIDRDPIAVELAGAAIWIETGATLPPGSLVTGDALKDASLDWTVAFPEVFAKGGFDAFVGNPPWISFVGRAAQPMAPAEKRALAAKYEAFAGYRNLQGVFIERCAELLAPGGRMGMLVPSSMSEQAGYAPTRRAHDRACLCDDALLDLGDSFEGVFQPCMALVSTKRRAPIEPGREPWPMERPDMDDVARAIVRKMSQPPLPPHLFGERGLQSMGDDRAHMSALRDRAHSVPLRAGGDIGAFRRGPPSLFADATWFGRRLPPASAFSKVSVLIRQTARVPTACLSDGKAFRNSILAGFADDDYPAEFLVAYLNAAPIRFLHYTRNRDARQGMPQVKIGHLRSLPAPADRRLVVDLAQLGAALSRNNRGVAADAQARVDDVVASGFGLDREERDRIAAWTHALR